MGKNERQAYLKAIRSRYRRAGGQTRRPSWMNSVRCAVTTASTRSVCSAKMVNPESGSGRTGYQLLGLIRLKQGCKGLTGTKPSSLLKNQIPIRTHFWDISQPGFMEADTVAHCGNNLAGDFTWSLTMTAIHTT